MMPKSLVELLEGERNAMQMLYIAEESEESYRNMHCESEGQKEARDILVQEYAERKRQLDKELIEIRKCLKLYIKGLLDT